MPPMRSLDSAFFQQLQKKSGQIQGGSAFTESSAGEDGDIFTPVMKRLALFLSLLIASASGDIMWHAQASQPAPTRPSSEVRQTPEPSPRRITAKSSKESIAYQALGEALASHPGMEEANRLDRMARTRYRTALKSGDPGEIPLARRGLSAAKAFRFETAASIPELRKLIEAWQAAARSQNTAEDPREELRHVSVRKEHPRVPARLIVD